MTSFVYYFSILMGLIYVVFGLLLVITEFYPFININLPYKPVLGTMMFGYGAFRIYRIFKQNQKQNENIS